MYVQWICLSNDPRKDVGRYCRVIRLYNASLSLSESRRVRIETYPKRIRIDPSTYMSKNWSLTQGVLYPKRIRIEIEHPGRTSPFYVFVQKLVPHSRYIVPNRNVSKTYPKRVRIEIEHPGRTSPYYWSRQG